MNTLQSFTKFYELWIKCLEDYHEMLNSLLIEKYFNHKKCADAVAKTINHHEEYYTFKWAAVHAQPKLFLSPPWLTSLEKLQFWFTDWRPNMIFYLVDWFRQQYPSFLSCHQLKMIEHLKRNINLEIMQVERVMEMEQEAVVNWQIMEIAREMSLEGGNNGEATTEEIGQMMAAVATRHVRGFQKVVKMADCVRLKSLKGILKILDVKQCVNFLAWFTYMQLHIKWLGVMQDM